MTALLMVFFSGLSIGMISSFHCVGMCGPLALSLPINNSSPVNKAASILLYNTGRALSYTSLGVLIGLVGRGFSLFNLQQYLSIVAGVLILSIMLLSKSGNVRFPGLTKLTYQIKQRLSLYLKSDKKLISFLYIGLLNGLLPCGLVYIAISASLSAGSIFKSSLMMFAFGLGTFPIMALLMIFGKFISFKTRLTINKLTPYIIMTVGCLLILRGLNLDIPYVSPAVKTYKTPTEVTTPVSCCHK